MDTHKSSATPAASPKRVWIVDDDEAVLRLMTRRVSDAGHHVTSFNDFEAAKRHLAGAQPDVLVTDVRLGAFNGLQLVVLGRMNHPEMQAVVLTGFDDRVIREQTAHAGASYLVKPVSMDQLLERIALALAAPAQPGDRYAESRT